LFSWGSLSSISRSAFRNPEILRVGRGGRKISENKNEKGEKEGTGGVGGEKREKSGGDEIFFNI